MKIKLLITTIIFALIFAPISVSAQSWYSSYLDTGTVLGAGNSRRPSDAGPPNTQPGNSTSNNNEDNENTNLRRNNFTEVQEIRNMTQEERQERIEELRALRLEERCERISNNIERRSDYYQNSHTQHLNRYQGISLRVSIAVERLQELGYDTAEIESNLEELDSMIEELNILHDEMSSTLINSKPPGCEEGSSDFRSQLTETREALAEIREQVREIQSFIQTQLVEAITSIKSQDGDDDDSDGPGSGTGTGTITGTNTL